MKRAESMNVIL